MPVLVGAGQVLQRDADPATALEPLALLHLLPHLMRGFVSVRGVRRLRQGL